MSARMSRGSEVREAAREYLLHDGSGLGLDAENPWRGDYDARAMIEARQRLRAILDCPVCRSGDVEHTDLLTVDEVAERRNAHPHTVRAAIRVGELRAKRVGRVFVIRRGDADHWTPRAPGRPGPNNEDAAALRALVEGVSFRRGPSHLNDPVPAAVRE